MNWLASLLTRKRITVQASLLALLLWSAYAVDIATPGLRDRAGDVKAADFLHFYTAAQLLRAGHTGDLYNPVAHATLQKDLLPESAGTYFVPMYGPQVYLLFKPLAAWPYRWAALVWAVVSVAVYFGCCSALLRQCRYLRKEWRLILLLAIAYPAFFSLIAFGQSSAPALALFTLAFIALQARRPFLAGLAIGSLIYKPQLGLAAAIILPGAAEWNMISGAVIAAVAQIGFAWAWFGAKVMKLYIRNLLQLQSAHVFLEPKLFQMHSLRSFWNLLLPWTSAALALYILTATGILAVGVACWRNGNDLRLRYAAFLLCTVLVAPHLWIYDLVILAPALLLIAEWLFEHHDRKRAAAIWLMLYACYGLPLLGPLSKFTHLQLSVLAFAATTLMLAKLNHSALSE